VVGRCTAASGVVLSPQPRQAQAPPHAHPPAACEPASPAGAFPATNENCLRTRSLPHDGQARAVSTDAVIGRRSSNRCSHAMQRYSYAAIARGRIPLRKDVSERERRVRPWRGSNVLSRAILISISTPLRRFDPHLPRWEPATSSSSCASSRACRNEPSRERSARRSRRSPPSRRATAPPRRERSCVWPTRRGSSS
jgi:hypothetical protein